MFCKTYYYYCKVLYRKCDTDNNFYLLYNDPAVSIHISGASSYQSTSEYYKHLENINNQKLSIKIAYNMASKNTDFHIDVSNESDTSMWNSTSWGNISMLIFYGQNFPNKQDEVSKLKIIAKTLADRCLY